MAHISKENTAPIIVGTETEFGIAIKNAPTQDPVLASSLVVNAYKGHEAKHIAWDYGQESPLMDARGFMSEEVVSKEPDDELNIIINDILINGGRFYVDHAHPEYCTPECTNPRDLLIYEKAGDRILDIARIAAGETLPEGQEIIIYKNNSDHKDHSYGGHENYLMSRETKFQDIIDGMTPFFVTRQIITGSGKIGAENNTEHVDFQIAQRADFFETEVGLSTMVSRPIINTRDEPHADIRQFRRLHVIIGDSNMSEFSIYLKIGITAIALKLIEKGIVSNDLKLTDPVPANQAVSRDLTCKQKLELLDGRKLSPIEIQRIYLELAKKHISDDDMQFKILDVMKKWEFILNQLEKDPMLLDRHLDWVIKKRLIETYAKRHQLDWKNKRLQMLDLQYHDIRPDKGLYARLVKNGRVHRIVSSEEIEHAITNPPIDTRAYFRGTCLRKYPEQVHSASWNSMAFNTGESLIDRVFMDRPYFGTQKLVGNLFNDNRTASELVEAIRESNLKKGDYSNAV